MASIEFHSNEGFQIPAGSGLGLFGGAGFGASVRVGEYQDRTYITNAAGSAQGAEVDNVKWAHANSGIIGPGATGSTLELTHIPNYQSTLKISFLHGSVVQTQNAVGQIYDRTDTSNAPSGVTTKVAEIIHPETSQVVTGSGDTSWISASGDMVTVPFVASPGLSGLRPDGASTSGTRHDWHCVISATPTSIGNKDKFGLYFSVEFV